MAAKLGRVAAVLQQARLRGAQLDLRRERVVGALGVEDVPAACLSLVGLEAHVMAVVVVGPGQHQVLAVGVLTDGGRSTVSVLIGAGGIGCSARRPRPGADGFLSPGAAAEGAGGVGPWG